MPFVIFHSKLVSIQSQIEFNLNVCNYFIYSIELNWLPLRMEYAYETGQTKSNRIMKWNEKSNQQLAKWRLYMQCDMFEPFTTHIKSGWFERMLNGWNKMLRILCMCENGISCRKIVDNLLSCLAVKWASRNSTFIGTNWRYAKETLDLHANHTTQCL